MNKNLLSDFDNQVLIKFKSNYFEDHELDIWSKKELEKVYQLLKILMVVGNGVLIVLK